MHGGTDAPTVDLAVQTIGTIYNNVSYGNVTNYTAVLPGAYTFNVLDSSGTQNYTSFEADLSALADSALAIFVSGFLEPSLNQNGPNIGFLLFFPMEQFLNCRKQADRPLNFLMILNPVPETGCSPAAGDYRLFNLIRPLIPFLKARWVITHPISTSPHHG